jgi:predicted transcriptional regulator
MSESETITVRLASATKDRLGQLAAQTNRTKSYLAAEAIATYVDREMEIVSGIERGLADMKTGRVVSHADAMEQLRQTVAKAAKAKS